MKKFKIVRIKKSFRKYREFWYNGMANGIFFVTELNEKEWKAHEFGTVTPKPANFPVGIDVINPTHAGFMILKKHCEVIAELN